MKVAVVGGRIVPGVADRVVDASLASGGTIPAEPAAMFAAWPDLRRLARDFQDADGYPAMDTAALELPMPVPLQVFGIGVNNPQFGLGKSAPEFGPVGPWIVSADEFDHEVRLGIRCEIGGVGKQSSSTRHLIFDVRHLVSYLSQRVCLRPGDIVFTGTPAGVGWGRTPKEHLAVGDQIVTTVDGIGALTTRIGRR